MSTDNWQLRDDEPRDALLAEALAQAGENSLRRLRERMRAQPNVPPLRVLVDAYLANDYMDPDGAADPPRGEAEQRLRALIGLVRETLPSDAPDNSAWMVVATMTGALQMARVLGRDRGGLRILDACRTALLARYEHAGRVD